MEVGRRRGKERERIREEEDRAEMASQREEQRIKEAEEEKQMGKSDENNSCLTGLNLVTTLPP